MKRKKQSEKTKRKEAKRNILKRNEGKIAPI